VASFSEYGDEPSGSGATDLVIYSLHNLRYIQIRIAVMCGLGGGGSYDTFLLLRDMAFL
jgi:hypothetical protein